MNFKPNRQRRQSKYLIAALVVLAFLAQECIVMLENEK
jgi:hypothetical protein